MAIAGRGAVLILSTMPTVDCHTQWVWLGSGESNKGQILCGLYFKLQASCSLFAGCTLPLGRKIVNNNDNNNRTSNKNNDNDNDNDNENEIRIRIRIRIKIRIVIVIVIVIVVIILAPTRCLLFLKIVPYILVVQKCQGRALVPVLLELPAKQCQLPQQAMRHCLHRASLTWRAHGWTT